MRRQEGFTLIEILAVIAILGLLMGIAMVGIGKFRQQGNIAATRARIETLQLMIQKYESHYGSCPEDTLAKYKITSNGINEGIEALYVGLHLKDFAEGANLDDKMLINTDDDTTATLYHRVAGFNNSLFEVADLWGNPIAYFRFSDYGKKQTYRLADSPDPENADQDVSARQSKTTGTWVNPDGYQLISAGPDRIFGTDDDVTN
jgi:prepilin-type N-terminal cleavage/methylation domain-containing protein